MYSVRVHRVSNGEYLDSVQVESCDWGRGDRSVRDAVIPLGDDGLTVAERNYLFQERTRMLAVCWNDEPIYFGRIANADYDETTEKLSIKHQDIRALANKRHLWGVGWFAPTNVMDWRGYSTRGVARQALYYAFVHPYSPEWVLNVDVGGAELGSSPWAQFFGYDLQRAEDILQLVEDIGPDIELEPEFRSGVAWWRARIGTPYLSGPTFELPLRAQPDPSTGEGGSLLNVKQLSDSTEQGTGVFVIGRGSEQDMRYAQTAITEAHEVSSDFIVPYKDVDNPAVLAALGEAWLQAHKRPRKQWSADVLTSDVPPSEIRVGSMLNVLATGSKWQPDGVLSRRVLGYSGSVGTSRMSLVLEEG